jgi:hypothetical protein
VTIELIRPGRHHETAVPKLLVSRDCGPEGCEVDWLVSKQHEVDLDVGAFTDYALKEGWGDGLPLIPPTSNRVRTYLSQNDRYPDEVVALLPPTKVELTVEKIVINMVMAGAPPEALELIISAIETIADPDFELYGVNATTAPVYPAFVVNGPIRDKLGIPYGYGCLGGVEGKVAAIGRTIRLIMRNIAGQVAGLTSQTTFGSPGRVAGIVTGEWEEKSPWAPLAERRGVKGDAVTSFGTMGTMNVIDTTSHHASDFLEMIGKSVAYAGCNAFSGAVPFAEMMIAINPICAEIVGREMPKIEDVQEVIWKYASADIDDLQRLHWEQLEQQGRIREDGRVYATPEPKDIIVFVAGGLGGLHATGFHSFGTSLAQTRQIAQAVPKDQAHAAE